ncbi:MAG: alpha-N-arabinofuranosidase [Oliverpabstia sp.]
MYKTKIIINKDFQIGAVDSRVFGSFVEHMGRVVYGGIYEKDHPTADENGFRKDVLEKTKEMGVSTVRYPGGNFISNYNWMDGIGPRDQRPRKRELAWKSIETNEIGIDEFMKWAKSAEIDPILAVNLGTRGLEDALTFLEYCNSDAGTYYSDLRVQNGQKEPYAVKTWCLGNEMDGDWQIGHKTADEYGRIAYETGKAMKILDPSIELIVCGSSMSRNATFGEWDRVVMKHTFNCADYISLHQYYGNQEKGTAAFLAQSLDFERYIQTVRNICDVEAVMRKSRKRMKIAVDEWGVWSISDKEVQAHVERNPWQIAPSFSEQIYSMEDTLLFASMLMAMLKNADRVKIACQSLLTNISACIMTTTGGEVWVQPIFYVFSMLAQHTKGYVLADRASGTTYDVEDFESVPMVDHICVYDEANRELDLFFVNRGDAVSSVEVQAQSFDLGEVVECVAITAKNLKDNNKEDHTLITPKKIDNITICENKAAGELLPYSFEMVRVKLK